MQLSNESPNSADEFYSEIEKEKSFLFLRMPGGVIEKYDSKRRLVAVSQQGKPDIPLVGYLPYMKRDSLLFNFKNSFAKSLLYEHADNWEIEKIVPRGQSWKKPYFMIVPVLEFA